MADIVLGLGSSHSPQLSTPPDLWAAYGDGDKRHRELWAADGKPYSFAELLATADAGLIAKELTAAKFQTRYAACQQAIAALGRRLDEVAPDIIVMIGDDQQELFNDGNMPATLVYWGDTIRSAAIAIPADAPAHRQANAWGWHPERDIDYPVAAALGRHLIEYLVEQQFDVAHSRRLPPGQGMGHAFGYLYQRLLRQKPIPALPIMVNTYYPPNQATPQRCYRLGQAVRAAIQEWPGQARVAVAASGGLSHFVIDQDLDNAVLQALENRDTATLFNLPRTKLNSGNSEIRNWIVAAGAVEHLDLRVVDYVPCYRSPAGTGCAMGFGLWG